MKIEPVAFFHSPLTSKFGIPRQSGLARSVPGRIVFTPEYRHAEAVRGLENFDFLWIIWEFSANRQQQVSGSSGQRLTVRPPRLGGNERVGVFASRSPFRPNALGLSCVRIDRIELEGCEAPVVHVTGADLMDGTPIYDIKPYVAYADSHSEARSGFVDTKQWEPLRVEVDNGIDVPLGTAEMQALKEVLAQDPRPQYHDDGDRVYGMPFYGFDVRFRVKDNTVVIVGFDK